MARPRRPEIEIKLITRICVFRKFSLVLVKYILHNIGSGFQSVVIHCSCGCMVRLILLSVEMVESNVSNSAEVCEFVLYIRSNFYDKKGYLLFTADFIKSSQILHSQSSDNVEELEMHGNGNEQVTNNGFCQVELPELHPENDDILYGLRDIPPWYIAIALGFQVKYVNLGEDAS